MAPLDNLLDDIFGGNHPALAAEFATWLRGSRRFRAFAQAQPTKIRAKLRNAREDGQLQDVRAELQTAALLLREDRFTLEYEKYAALKQRGPDFTVTYRTHTPFNVEVRRVRASEWGDDADFHAAKLMAVLCDKVGQMPPGIVNLLYLISERPITEAEVAGAAAALRQMADAKNDDYFARRGYRNAADFLKQYRHLSGVVLRQPDAHAVWLNPLARHKPPPDIVAALRRLPVA